MHNIDRYCNNEKVLRFLVANKCDLYQDRRIEFDDLLEKCEDYNIKGFETSTMPGFRGTIDELFKEVIE